MLSGRVAQHGFPRGGKNFDKRNVVLEFESSEAWIAKGGECCQVGSQSMGCQEGGKIDKRNVVLELESLKACVAKGGEKFDKRNVVLELESLKAWVAKGGKFEKRNFVR